MLLEEAEACVRVLGWECRKGPPIGAVVADKEG